MDEKEFILRFILTQKEFAIEEDDVGEEYDPVDGYIAQARRIYRKVVIPETPAGWKANEGSMPSWLNGPFVTLVDIITVSGAERTAVNPRKLDWSNKEILMGTILFWRESRD